MKTSSIETEPTQQVQKVVEKAEEKKIEPATPEEQKEEAQPASAIQTFLDSGKKEDVNQDTPEEPVSETPVEDDVQVEATKTQEETPSSPIAQTIDTPKEAVNNEIE